MPYNIVNETKVNIFFAASVYVLCRRRRFFNIMHMDSGTFDLYLSGSSRLHIKQEGRNIFVFLSPKSPLPPRPNHHHFLAKSKIRKEELERFYLCEEDNTKENISQTIFAVNTCGMELLNYAAKPSFYFPNPPSPLTHARTLTHTYTSAEREQLNQI